MEQNLGVLKLFSYTPFHLRLLLLEMIVTAVRKRAVAKEDEKRDRR